MDGAQFRGRKIHVDFEMGHPKRGYKLQYDSNTNTKYNQQVKGVLRKKTI